MKIIPYIKDSRESNSNPIPNPKEDENSNQV